MQLRDLDGIDAFIESVVLGVNSQEEQMKRSNLQHKEWLELVEKISLHPST